MKTEQIWKWFGVLAVLAGLMRMGMTPTSLIWGTDSTQELVFGFIACILMALASFGFFLVQQESGVFGFVSTLSLVLFNAMTACMVWFLLATGQTGETSVLTSGNSFIMITKIIIMLGMFLGTPAFTFITFRAKVFPRWVVILWILSMVIPILPLMEKWGALFWGIAYVGMGFVMVTGKYAKRRTFSDVTVTA